MFGLSGVQNLSPDGAALKRVITREPISIFSQIKNVKDEEKKEKLTQLLETLKKNLPEGFKIGAAVSAGDCFFDSVAQRLNELKGKGLIASDEGFNVQSLRRGCKEYAQRELNTSKNSWLNKLLDKESEKLPEYIPRIEFTAEDIKNASSGSAVGILNLQNAIWGRPEVEGKMICEKYDVKIKIIELRDEEIGEVHVTKGKLGTGNNIIYIVNYRNHFVPLLKDIEKDVEEYIEVSREEVYGLGSHSFIEDTGNHDLEEQKPQVQVQLNQDSFTAINVYSRLKEVNFDSDDSDNPGVWAGMDQINSYINNQAIKTSANGDELAYYIGPNNFGFDSKEGIEDIAKHICRKKDISNSFYDDEKSLDKPFIVISNTTTVLAQSSTNVNLQGGAHWISWVLLPKKYVSLSGKEINNDKCQVFFFDSLSDKSFPEGLKKFLIEGDEITEITDTGKKCIRLLPFCTKEEIDFCDLKELTGQQREMNGSECGWWAVYYALMTIYTGGVEFLNALKGRKLSAVPLRNIMNLQEASIIQQQSLQNKENHYKGSSVSAKSSLDQSSKEFIQSTKGGNLSICLQNTVIDDIAKYVYKWTEDNNVIWGVEGPGRLPRELNKFKKSKDKTLIYIVNKDGNHWVTLVAIHINEQEDVFFYADSFGVGIEECRVNSFGRGKIDSDAENKVSYGNKVNQYSVDCNSQNIEENSDDIIFVEETAPLKQDRNDNIQMSLDKFLESKGYSKNNIHSVSCKQQDDNYNCGVFALENAKAILNVVKDDNDYPAKVKQSLERVSKGSESLNTLRKGFAEDLKEISNSTADKEAVKKRFTEKSQNLFSDLENLLKLDRRMSNLKSIIKKFVEKHTKGSNFLPRLLLGQFLCKNEDPRDTCKLDRYLLLYPENKIAFLLILDTAKSIVLNIIETEKASKKGNSNLNLIPKIDILLSDNDKLTIFNLKKEGASYQVNFEPVGMSDIKKKGSEVKCVLVDKMVISTDLLGKFTNEIVSRKEVIDKLGEVFSRAARMGSILIKDLVDCQAVFTGLLMNYCNKVSLKDKEAKLIISSSIGPDVPIWLCNNTANSSGYSFVLEQQENGTQAKSSYISNLRLKNKKRKEDYYAFLSREHEISFFQSDARGDRTTSHRTTICKERTRPVIIINEKDYGCNELHVAVFKNSANYVKKLMLANNIYVKGQDNYGNTPLHFAVQKSKLKLLRLS